VVVPQQATAAHGGHQWLWVVEKKVLGFVWAFVGEESEKNHVFLR